MHSCPRIERTERRLPRWLQVIHGSDVICTGQLKKYDVELSLPKEMIPREDCRAVRKPGREVTGVDPEEHLYLGSDAWYSFCERQNLQYGPHFRTVVKYSVDRTWAAIRQAPPPPPQAQTILLILSPRMSQLPL